MSVQYLHIWRDEEGEQFIHENGLSSDIDKAIDEYWQQLSDSFPYVHTVVFDLNAGTCETIDIELAIKEREDDAEPCQYERLTGHEMGICPGRV